MNGQRGKTQMKIFQVWRNLSNGKYLSFASSCNMDNETKGNKIIQVWKKSNQETNVQRITTYTWVKKGTDTCTQLYMVYETKGNKIIQVWKKNVKPGNKLNNNKIITYTWVKKGTDTTKL